MLQFLKCQITDIKFISLHIRCREFQQCRFKQVRTHRSHVFPETHNSNSSFVVARVQCNRLFSRDVIKIQNFYTLHSKKAATFIFSRVSQVKPSPKLLVRYEVLSGVTDKIMWMEHKTDEAQTHLFEKFTRCTKVSGLFSPIQVKSRL